MKYIIILILSILFSFCISATKIWDLNKSAKNLLESSNSYNYTIYHETKSNYDLKLIKIIEKSNGKITSSNFVVVNDDYDSKKRAYYENIESFHIIFGILIICPSGPYHPYNLETNQRLTPLDPQLENGWDLKCIYFENSKKFLISFIRNEKAKDRSEFYYTYDDYIYWRSISFWKLIYDFKISNVGEEDKYPMIVFLRSSEGNNTLYIERDDFYIYYKSADFVTNKTIINNLSNTKGYFKNNSTKFYFITYDDVNHFFSGYTNSSFDDNFDITNVSFIMNTNSPFEFEEELVFENINFTFNNKFIYYKLKNKDNNNTYHGIIDIELNKIIFNTNEEIKSFIPYSDKAMLAITSNTAYRICAYNNGNECIDYCPEGYIITTSGNICRNSSFCPFEKYILMPDRECVDSCDTTINIIDDQLCGTCSYFNPESPYKFINGTICLISPPDGSVIYDEDLYILICQEGYYLVNDTVCEKDIICYHTCKSCKEEPKDEFHQNCLDCKEDYLFENGNCLLNCSNGFEKVENECKDCNITICKNFSINSCDCLKCEENYYLNESDCYQCDSKCKTCFNNAKNCTSCYEKSFLYNGQCLECTDNCKEKESDSCKCLSCNEGYFFENYQCKKCIDNCKTCNNNDTCNSCFSGYILENNLCNKCNHNCKECFASSFNDTKQNCLSCKNDTKVLYNNNCVDECPDNFYKDENKECKECNNLCKEYDNNCNNCTSCYDGYYLKDNVCLECNEHCETCERGKEGNNEQCSSCNKSSEYKYLIEAEGFGRNCVKECPSGTILKEDKCILDEENTNLLIIIVPSIFVGTAIIIIIIIFLIYCRNKYRRTESQEMEENVDNTEVLELNRSFDM